MKKIIVLMCLVIAGCSGTPKVQYCPYLSIVPDGSHIVKYEEGTTRVFSQAVIKNADGYCKTENEGLTIGGSFDLYAVLGEKAPQTMHVPFEYFVAVLDEQNNVLSRQGYTYSIKFRKNRDSKSETIKFNQILLLNSDGELPKYNILLSFQLTEEELKDNRQRNNPY